MAFLPRFRAGRRALALVISLLLSAGGCALFSVGDEEQGENELPALLVQGGTVLHVRHAPLARKGSGRVLSGQNALNAVEELEITILLDNGREVIARQMADDFYKKGDRVRLLTDAAGLARVQHE